MCRNASVDVIEIILTNVSITVSKNDIDGTHLSHEMASLIFATH